MLLKERNAHNFFLLFLSIFFSQIVFFFFYVTRCTDLLYEPHMFHEYGDLSPFDPVRRDEMTHSLFATAR